jgi:ABC-type multidrug transport system ATPase subunit
MRQGQEVRSVTGFFAHSPGLYEDLTAAENLRFAARMLRVSEADVPLVLERVGLWGERNERVRGFSAGMQRRLALGRLMLSRPRLLLLDEPYNNFDPAGIALVDEVIRAVREAGGAALVVIHDRRQGAELLTRIVELRRGVVAGDSEYVAGEKQFAEPAVQGGR